MEQELQSRKDSNFDILSWWKVNQVEFPILSRLARDILSMQVSTVASESAFSAGGRVVDPFRGRLEPETVEALICTKSWIGASKGNLLNFISTSCTPCDIIILIIIIINHLGSDIASVVKDMDMPSLEERFTTLVHMVCILSIF